MPWSILAVFRDAGFGWFWMLAGQYMGRICWWLPVLSGRLSSAGSPGPYGNSGEASTYPNSQQFMTLILHTHSRV